MRGLKDAVKKSNPLTSISDEHAKSAPKLCFVVSPIGAADSAERRHADWLLKGIIGPVFREHFTEFRVDRADRIATPGMIDSQVINCLLDAELVIADMSMLNANAFYEMGIRHMRQLPIIHMFLTGQAIPFDVAPYRAIPFSFAHPDDLELAKEQLKASVEETLKADFIVENPVTRARGALKLQENATSEERIILAEIAALQVRVAQLERPNMAAAPLSAIGMRIMRATVFYVRRPESSDLVDFNNALVSYGFRTSVLDIGDDDSISTDCSGPTVQGAALHAVASQILALLPPTAVRIHLANVAGAATVTRPVDAPING